MTNPTWNEVWFVLLSCGSAYTIGLMVGIIIGSRTTAKAFIAWTNK